MDVDEEVFVLAPDDHTSWERAADMAMRHIARVRTPVRRPRDETVESYYSSLPIDLEPASAPSHRFINYDRHIPGCMRVPETAQFILADIQYISAPLARRPSDYLVPCTRVWTCPHPQCVYSIDLSALNNDQAETVANKTKDAQPSFAQFDLGGGCVVSPTFSRSVVDILGLEHYSLTHLRRLGIRYTLYELLSDGKMAFFWEPQDWSAVFSDAGVRGTSARHHEETRQVKMREALIQEGIVWAEGLRLEVRADLYACRHRTRKEHSRFARRNYEGLLSLRSPDSVYEPRYRISFNRKAVVAMNDLYNTLHADEEHRESALDAVVRREQLLKAAYQYLN
ncbi:unnamed protein product [Peniophora sp. CBMAI 1063]|nr:unnamed protein product [Peniophora sp. CBMAI 1063]